MIGVDGVQIAEQPKALKEVYALIEPYYLRTVRLSYEQTIYSSSSNSSYKDTTIRTMGKLIGLSESSADSYSSFGSGRSEKWRTTESIVFFLEGQPPLDFTLDTFTLEVLQEDTRKWIAIYEPQQPQGGAR